MSWNWNAAGRLTFLYQELATRPSQSRCMFCLKPPSGKSASGSFAGLLVCTTHTHNQLNNYRVLLSQEEFRPNQTIFVRGQPGLKFYLIREGTAEVKQGTDILTTLGPGQYFGERALLGADVRAADVVVGNKGPLSCYTLTQEVFSELLGSQEDIWRYERLKEVSEGRDVIFIRKLSKKLSGQSCKQATD